MKGVMKAMLLKKLRLVVGTVMVLVALGALGLGYQANGGSGAARRRRRTGRRMSWRLCRKENELLKLNLQVVLEKVRAQETEIQGLHKQVAARTLNGKGAAVVDLDNDTDLVIPIATWLRPAHQRGPVRTVAPAAGRLPPR